MAAQPTLVRMLGAENAAAYINVARGTFLKMVEEKTMPPPKVLLGRRKAWDIRELDAAIDALPTDGAALDDTTWD